MYLFCVDLKSELNTFFFSWYIFSCYLFALSNYKILSLLGTSGASSYSSFQLPLSVREVKLGSWVSSTWFGQGAMYSSCMSTSVRRSVSGNNNFDMWWYEHWPCYVNSTNVLISHLKQKNANIDSKNKLHKRIYILIRLILRSKLGVPLGTHYSCSNPYTHWLGRVLVKLKYLLLKKKTWWWSVLSTPSRLTSHFT